jgi:hypothetical protein
LIHSGTDAITGMVGVQRGGNGVSEPIGFLLFEKIFTGSVIPPCQRPIGLRPYPAPIEPLARFMLCAAAPRIDRPASPRRPGYRRPAGPDYPRILALIDRPG